MPEPRPATDCAALPAENVYGNRKRLDWIRTHIPHGRPVLEVGCGTGYMICRPLARLGCDVHGIDLDEESIAFGREILSADGLDPGILETRPLSTLPGRFGAVIASEVLEHLHDAELAPFLEGIREHVEPGGTLLVTVPNGYGWFELEQLLWFKWGIGARLYRWRIQYLIERTKARWLGADAIAAGPPSTLAHSPHVQRFTLRKIRALLHEAGFDVVEARGSVAFAGPFCNLLFAGARRVLTLNTWLGDRCGPLASGFFLACRVRG